MFTKLYLGLNNSSYFHQISSETLENAVKCEKKK